MCFPIFVECGGADSSQLAARQGRLEHVGGVHGAFSGAGANQGVQLVDEQDDLALGFGDFLEQGFEAVFKFAAIFGTGHHGGQVQGHDALGLEHFGDVAGHNALGQPFDYGRFADAGLADQDGIILGTARQDLHYAADFHVAADYRIELAAAGQIGEVARILLQGAEGGFGGLRSDPMAAAHGGERLQDGFARCPHAIEELAGRVGRASGHGQQDVLRGDVFVLELRRLVESRFKNLIGRGAQELLGDATDLAGSRSSCFEISCERVSGRMPSRASSGGTTPSCCSTNASNRCSGSICCWPLFSRQCPAPPAAPPGLSL